MSPFSMLDKPPRAPRMRALMTPNYLNHQFTHALAAPPRPDTFEMIC